MLNKLRQWLYTLSKTEYTEDDFSEVFPASVKPNLVGWYLGTRHDAALVKMFPFVFYWWNGIDWRTSPTTGKLIYPVKWWCGLKERP